MYMARARPCTQSVHGRERPYTWVANTVVYRYTTVYTVLYLYTAVFTARVQGRPATGYMTRAVYRLCTRSCTGHVHGSSMTRRRPCTAVHPVHGRVYGPCTQPCTDREHGRCRIHGCSWLCTRPVHGRVQGPYTAMYTGRKDNRVHGTRPCTVHGPCLAVYTVRSRGCVQALKTTVCTDHVRPCTGSVHAVNSRVHGP